MQELSRLSKKQQRYIADLEDKLKKANQQVEQLKMPDRLTKVR